MRLLAEAALARWLPGGLVRSGLCVDGQLALPGLRARPLSWQVLAGGVDDAPQLSLRVPAADLDQVLMEHASETSLPGGATMQVTYVVDEGTIDDDDLPGRPSLTRRFKVVARGRIVVDAFRLRRVIEVRRIAGHALATFTPEGGLLHLGCTVAIEEAEADELKLPVIGDLQGLLLKQLEEASNRGLAKGLARALLPAPRSARSLTLASVSPPDAETAEGRGAESQCTRRPRITAPLYGLRVSAVREGRSASVDFAGLRLQPGAATKTTRPGEAS